MRERIRLCVPMLMMAVAVCTRTVPEAVSAAPAMTADETHTSGASQVAIVRRGEEFILLSSYSEEMVQTEKKVLKAASTGGSSVRWESSDKAVAQVDEQGTVTAQKPGTCLVTASTDGAKAVCRIVVKKPRITLSADRVRLRRGQHFRLKADVTNGVRVTYASDNKKIAVVDRKGEISAVSDGRCVITVSCAGVSARCRLNVVKNR